MKQSTGIIRRIDDLGRIVIPKMFREKLKIEEGQPFEIFMTKNGFVLDVYKPEPDKAKIAREWLNRNLSLLKRYKSEFSISEKYICCVAIIPEKDFSFSFGAAKCATTDKYDYNVGKIISFCRAIGEPKLIPKEFFE